MYLGLKEMVYEKFRYGLFSGVLLLIVFVVFMFVGLVNGLFNGNCQVVDQWYV